MSDLEAVVDDALRDLRRLVRAWQLAWQVRLDYGPSAQVYDGDGRPTSRGERPIPVRLDSRTGDVQETALSRDYMASVRQLACAVESLSHLTWNGPQTAAHAVVPARTSHVPEDAAMRIARTVHDGLHRTADRLRWGPPFDLADSVHVRNAREQVLVALYCLPDELTTDRHNMRVCSGAPLQPPCTRLIPKTHTRCATCRKRVERMRDADPDQRKAV